MRINQILCKLMLDIVSEETGQHCRETKFYNYQEKRETHSSIFSDLTL